MVLQYLGTAAAEGLPAPFCTCATCRRARRLGGANIRSRTQALVDGALLIDFPCDTFYHAALHGADLTRVQHCLVTHAHADHFYPAELGNFRRGFAQIAAERLPFHLYGSKDVEEAARARVAASEGRVDFTLLHPFTPVAVGGYTVTPLPADHGTAHRTST